MITPAVSLPHKTEDGRCTTITLSPLDLEPLRLLARSMPGEDLRMAVKITATSARAVLCTKDQAEIAQVLIEQPAWEDYQIPMEWRGMWHVPPQKVANAIDKQWCRVKIVIYSGSRAGNASLMCFRRGHKSPIYRTDIVPVLVADSYYRDVLDDAAMAALPPTTPPAVLGYHRDAMRVMADAGLRPAWGVFGAWAEYQRKIGLGVATTYHTTDGHVQCLVLSHKHVDAAGRVFRRQLISELIAS